MKRSGVRSVAGMLALLIAPFLAAGCGGPESEDAEAEVGAGPAASEVSAVDAELDSVYAAFSEAYARADVQMLLNEVYAPDAFYLPPGSPILRGHDQFRNQFGFLEPYAAAGDPGPEISFEIVDRDVQGDLAYDIGYYILRAPDSPPDSEGSRGKFIVVWKRDAEGRWRIHADGYSGVAE
jgi:ketosteroid isomerase-like protein